VKPAEVFNLALRAIMETGLVAALAYWGFHTGTGAASKFALGLVLPLLVFAFWGLVDFRQAGRLGEVLRLIQELVLTGLAALALYAAGQAAAALLLAAVSLLHHILVYALGGRLLKAQ